MRVLRSIGNATLWLLAVVGVLSGTLWAAGQLGFVQPIVVASGSMSPDLMPGDLLLARRLPAAEIQPGDVLTLDSPRTENFVTHRVTEVTRVGDYLEVTMKGDANSMPDSEVYRVPTSDDVWHPMASIPGLGAISIQMTQSPLAIPALVSLLALVGFAAIPPKRGRHERVRRLGDRFRSTARSATA